MVDRIGRDDNISVLNNTLEVLVHGITINLELDDISINLVNEEDGFNLLSDYPFNYFLGMNANTFETPST